MFFELWQGRNPVLKLPLVIVPFLISNALVGPVADGGGPERFIQIILRIVLHGWSGKGEECGPLGCRRQVT